MRESAALLVKLRECQLDHECLSTSGTDQAVILNCNAESDVSVSADADPVETCSDPEKLDT